MTDYYELNKDVYDNNLEKLDSERLNKSLGIFDVHGLSPLHLAFRMGRTDYLKLFFDKAKPEHFLERTRNDFRWSMRQEAVCMRDKEILRTFHRIRMTQKLKNLKDLLSKTSNLFARLKIRKKSSREGTLEIIKHGTKTRISYEEPMKKHPLVIIYNPEKYGSKLFKINQQDDCKTEYFNLDFSVPWHINSLIDKAFQGFKSERTPMNLSSVSDVTMKMKLTEDGLNQEREECEHWSAKLYEISFIANIIGRCEHLSFRNSKKLMKEADKMGTGYAVDGHSYQKAHGSFMEYLGGVCPGGQEPEVLELGSSKPTYVTLGLAEEFSVSLDSTKKFITENFLFPEAFLGFFGKIFKRFPMLQGFPVFVKGNCFSYE
ncbi:uncharacterized protein LOC142349441 isoform X2 [Convolutriloba macropyga]|uniref:uncharacterized protein LOC142349441 isoform X2 n=1 Tax=Convolutriloba macropyga TaxID=536237 RepID=UPI003F5222CE